MRAASVQVVFLDDVRIVLGGVAEFGGRLVDLWMDLATELPCRWLANRDLLYPSSFESELGVVWFSFPFRTIFLDGEMADDVAADSRVQSRSRQAVSCVASHSCGILVGWGSAETCGFLVAAVANQVT